MTMRRSRVRWNGLPFWQFQWLIDPEYRRERRLSMDRAKELADRPDRDEELMALLKLAAEQRENS